MTVAMLIRSMPRARTGLSLRRRLPHASPAVRGPRRRRNPVLPQAPDAGLVLTDTLTFMQTLWALAHALDRTSKRMAAELGVTGPQCLVLRVVGLAPHLSAGTLASTLHVHPSTLTGVLERLVAQRLMKRAPHPGDRRRAVLSLTAKGSRINALRRGTTEAVVADALAGLDRADLDATLRVLRRLTRYLSAPADGD